MKRLLALIGLLLVNVAYAQTPDSRPGCTYNLVAPTLATAQQVALQCDANGQLKIAGSINATSAATATAADPTYVEGTSNPLSQDLSGHLRVTGSLSLAGTTSNASSGVATSSTNLPTVGYLYGFNGTTWDQLQVDGSKFLKTISQAGSTTVVTQATAGNLNATVVGTGTFTVQAQQSGSWSLAANQSVNVAQINGVTPLMGNGASGTGAQRVTIANDSTGIISLTTGSAQIGHLEANQSVNLAQIAGTTTLTGNGTAGAGAQRVTIASDNTAFSVNATLSAETTKVIGTVRTLGNAGAIFDGVNTAAAAPANGILGLGIYNSTEPSPTTGQSVGIQLDSKGRQRMVLYDAAGNTRGANVNASNQLSVSVDAVSATNISTNIAQMNGVAVTMGNGASGTGVQRVTIANDSTGIIALTTGSSQIGHLEANQSVNVAQINGVTPLMGNGASGTGAQRVTIANDSTGIIALTTGSAQIGHLEANQSVNVAQINGVTPLMGAGNTGTGSPRVTIASDQATIPVSTTAVTSGGTSLYTLTLAASTNATNVKASAGQVYSISGFNMSSATPVWISLYNNSGTPTCGTSIIQQFMIPGNTTGAGFVYDFATPKAFSSGIAFCATTGIAGTGNPAATTYVLNIDYK